MFDRTIRNVIFIAVTDKVLALVVSYTSCTHIAKKHMFFHRVSLPENPKTNLFNTFFLQYCVTLENIKESSKNWGNWFSTGKKPVSLKPVFWQICGKKVANKLCQYYCFTLHCILYLSTYKNSQVVYQYCFSFFNMMFLRVVLPKNQTSILGALKPPFHQLSALVCCLNSPDGTSLKLGNRPKNRQKTDFGFSVFSKNLAIIYFSCNIWAQIRACGTYIT